jgi:hypothetical protein
VNLRRSLCHSRLVLSHSPKLSSSCKKHWLKWIDEYRIELHSFESSDDLWREGNLHVAAFKEVVMHAGHYGDCFCHRLHFDYAHKFLLCIKNFDSLASDEIVPQRFRNLRTDPTLYRHSRSSILDSKHGLCWMEAGWSSFYRVGIFC